MICLLITRAIDLVASFVSLFVCKFVTRAVALLAQVYYSLDIVLTFPVHLAFFCALISKCVFFSPCSLSVLVPTHLILFLTDFQANMGCNVMLSVNLLHQAVRAHHMNWPWLSDPDVINAPSF